MFDVVIRGSMVLDGTAAPAFRANVGLSGGQVASFAPASPATIGYVTRYFAPVDGPHPALDGRRHGPLNIRYLLPHGSQVLSGGALTPAARSTSPGRVLRPG